MAAGKPPLYFQHEGHSRTIVGVERSQKSGGVAAVHLLVLDPSQGTAPLQRALCNKEDWQVCCTAAVVMAQKKQRR